MLNMIACMDKNRVIGNGNKLPWHLPEDLNYFKKTTLGKKVVMGRKTYESLGKPLINRENIILTRDMNYQAPGCQIIHNIQDILSGQDEIFVIGGEQIYNVCLPFADRLYLTHIHYSFSGDAYFPLFDVNDYRVISSEKGIHCANYGYEYTFTVLEKNK